MNLCHLLRRKMLPYVFGFMEFAYGGYPPGLPKFAARIGISAEQINLGDFRYGQVS